MKPFTLSRLFPAILLLSTVTPSSMGQSLYTTANNTLIRFDATDASCTPVASFLPSNLAMPIGAMVHIGNGVLIGVTNNTPSLYGAMIMRSALAWKGTIP